MSFARTFISVAPAEAILVFFDGLLSGGQEETTYATMSPVKSVGISSGADGWWQTLWGRANRANVSWHAACLRLNPMHLHLVLEWKLM